MEDNFKLRYFVTAVITIIGICSCFFVAKMMSDTKQPAIVERVDTIYIDYQLTDWQLFQLALIEVESDYNSEAVSSENARGIFQEMPIYIKEVNRIIGTEWTHMDAHNDTIALDCFTVIQNRYNPTKDIVTAIRLHNPTAGMWYERRVLDKMADIKRREQIRTLIVNY